MRAHQASDGGGRGPSLNGGHQPGDSMDSGQLGPQRGVRLYRGRAPDCCVLGHEDGSRGAPERSRRDRPANGLTHGGSKTTGPGSAFAAGPRFNLSAISSLSQMASATTAKNVRQLSRCDQGGRPDGVQVLVHKGHAFIGHMFSDGFSVVDVRDPLQPKSVAFVAAPKNTRSHHLQIHGDVLLAVNGPNIWAMQQYATQQDYYAKSLIDSVQTEQPFAAGLRVFDISKPSSPREIAFLNMPGFGAHRIWWVGGHYAYRALVATGHESCRRRNAAHIVRQAHGTPSPH